jgi:hypothetical protein
MDPSKVQIILPPEQGSQEPGQADDDLEKQFKR